MRTIKWICVLLAAVCLLSGCAMRTVDQMYQLPRRAESDSHLQAAMDAAMNGCVYSAPLSGEHQQTVQMADLDGDGEQEYLLFARASGGDKPLQIFVFSQNEGGYQLSQTIQSNGSAFDLVEYVQMDDRKGLELVVGCQVSDQVLRSVSVYTFSDGNAKSLLTTNYSKFLTCDLDSDRYAEMMVLRPGQSGTDNGVAELYGLENGAMFRYNEAGMSGPADRLKRIITGKLHGGSPAVFVGTAVDENAIITDVYTVVDGILTNVSYSNESGTSVNTLRNYYVYAADIDDDGEVELPDLITMTPLDRGAHVERQFLIRWFSMTTDGAEVDKMYTYHNYVEGWYLQMEETLVSRLSVVQEESAYSFYLWDAEHSKAEKVFTIFAFTGSDREEQAMMDDRFVLHRGDSVVYAAQLEDAQNSVFHIEDLIKGFHLIRQDWKTGEM